MAISRRPDPAMRIVVIGDFQYNEGEEELTRKAIVDIVALEPDRVVTLGDYGPDLLVGTQEGMAAVAVLLSSVGERLRPILGNHDVEYRSGDRGGVRAEGFFRKAFDMESLWTMESGPGCNFFYLSLEAQPRNSMVTRHECYVSDTQYEWFSDMLHIQRGIPAIVFCHVAPAGSGLRSLPDIHASATNAYLQQNTMAARWVSLVRETPEIVLWFCGHYHLGQDYIDAVSNAHGTYYILTGLHSNRSRDNLHQSRVLDIDEGGITIYTLDHHLGRLRKPADLVWEGGFDSLLRGRQPVGRYHIHEKGCFFIGADEPVGALPEPHNRCLYIATAGGRIWEYDSELDYLSGPIVYHRTAERFWINWPDLIVETLEGLIAIDLRSPLRFDRKEGIPPNHRPIKVASGILMHTPVIQFSDSSVIRGEDWCLEMMKNQQDVDENLRFIGFWK